MGNTRNVDMSSQEIEVKQLADPNAPEVAVEGGGEKTTAKKKLARVRSKKYQAVKTKVDRTRKYDPMAALELVKQLSYAKFGGTIVADVEVKDLEVSAELTLPHSTGKLKKVVVVDDAVLAEIEAGKLDFDILVSSPQFMPKLAKYAKTLGPKGLMPNPKNGTLTPNPERAVKELSAGKMMLKTEKKQPLIHVVLGKTTLETKQLMENLEALLKALKGKVARVSVAPTMGPGVKVEIETA